MLVEKTKTYLSSKKKLVKNNNELKDQIDQVEKLLEINHLDTALDFKKIICKKDKSRKSVKIPNTQYRILLSHDEDTFVLVCVCNHNRYQIRNKNC